MTDSEWLTKLTAALTPATHALVLHIAEEAERMGYKAFLVGGPVRDMVLGHPVKDIDIVLEGAAIPLARHLAKKLGGYALTHDRFGTAKWTLDDPDFPPIHPLTQAEGLPPFIDLITARRESYDYPAALPTVTFAGMKEDLLRRDFVINTLALQLNGAEKGRLLDPYGGIKDLREGRIRILHHLSFIDDPTRIFRALRFAERLKFRFMPHTRTRLQQAIPLIALLTPDRVRHELLLLLEEANAVTMLDKLAKWGAFPYLFPGIGWSKLQRAKVAALKKAGEGDKATLFAALLWGATVDTIPLIADRLALSNEWRVPLLALAALQEEPLLRQPTLRNSELYFCLRKANEQALEWLARLSDDATLRAHLRLFLDDLRHRPMPITGDDLKAWGIPPGKQYQTILDQVRAAVMDDVALPNNPKALLTALSIP